MLKIVLPSHLFDSILQVLDGIQCLRETVGKLVSILDRGGTENGRNETVEASIVALHAADEGIGCEGGGRSVFEKCKIQNEIRVLRLITYHEPQSAEGGCSPIINHSSYTGVYFENNETTTMKAILLNMVLN